MYRIDDASAASSMPTPEAAGTEGFWTEGNPATGVAATLERASWFNMMQEELRAVVVAGGQVPSKTTYNQLLVAIKAVISASFLQNAVSTGSIKFPSGLIINWGNVSAPAQSGTNVTYDRAYASGQLACVAVPIDSDLTTNYRVSSTNVNSLVGCTVITTKTQTTSIFYISIGL